MTSVITDKKSVEFDSVVRENTVQRPCTVLCCSLMADDLRVIGYNTYE